MQEIIKELILLSEKKKLFINKIKKEAKGYLDYHSIQRINGWTFVIIEIEVKIDVLSKLLGKIK